MTKAKYEILKLRRELIHYATECAFMEEKARKDELKNLPRSHRPDYFLGECHGLRMAAEELKMLADEMR